MCNKPKLSFMQPLRCLWVMTLAVIASPLTKLIAAVQGLRSTIWNTLFGGAGGRATEETKIPYIHDALPRAASFLFVPIPVKNTKSLTANSFVMQPKLRLLRMMLGVIVLLLITSFAYSQALSNVGPVTVTTDKPDYAPRSNAVFTGTGFLPGETVQLKVKNLFRACNTVTADSSYLPWTVTADANGGFVTNWIVCDCAGDSLRLKASGQTSGFIGYAYFSDADNQTTVTADPFCSGSQSITFRATTTGNNIKCIRLQFPTDLIPASVSSISLNDWTASSITSIPVSPVNAVNVSSSNPLGSNTLIFTVNFSSVPSGTGPITVTSSSGNNCPSNTNGANNVTVSRVITPTVTTTNACVGGANVTFTQSGGGAGSWSASGGAINSSTGVFTPTTAGCFTATYTTTTGKCSDTKSFVVFPSAPSAPTVNSGFEAIVVTPPATVSGFDIQYSFDDGANWGNNTPPIADNCAGYKIRTRYVTSSSCGSIAAGIASTNSSCGASPATTRIIDKTAPTITAPAAVSAPPIRLVRPRVWYWVHR